MGLIIAEVVMVFQSGLQGVQSLNPEFAEARVIEGDMVELNRTELITSSSPAETRSTKSELPLPWMQTSVTYTYTKDKDINSHVDCYVTKIEMASLLSTVNYKHESHYTF